MSNAVDILVIGGPKHGMVLCQPRPVPATFVHDGLEYTHQIHAEQYHIARRQVDDDNDEVSIAAAVAASFLQPSWDLREW